MRTVLQVPMPVNLRVKAEAASAEMGFSSLQEVVRVILSKLANRRLLIQVEDSLIPLSAKNESRYLKMDKDFIKKSKIGSVKNVRELLKQLNAD